MCLLELILAFTLISSVPRPIFVAPPVKLLESASVEYFNPNSRSTGWTGWTGWTRWTGHFHLAVTISISWPASGCLTHQLILGLAGPHLGPGQLSKGRA